MFDFLKREEVALILAAIVGCLWLTLALFRAFPDSQGTDFYPLWIGTQALIGGNSPYSHETIELLRRNWHVKQTVQVADVIGYPLPILILLTPLTLVPLDLAVRFWFILLITSIVVFSLAFDKKASVLILPLLFYPTFHAMIIKTTAILWLGLAGALIIALKRNMVALSGLCIALLPGKPQAGLIFAIAALFWAWKQNKSVLVSAALWGLILWGGSLIVNPLWPIEWLHAVQAYRQQVMLVWLLPQGAVLLLFSRALSWYAIVAAIQVITFPANDLYSSLPLLVGWMEIGGLLALLGVSCSWFATIFYQNPNNPLALWFTVLLPYCTAALVHSFKKRRPG